MSDVAYEHFQRKVLELAGVDLRQYKSAQMQRRLATLMRRAQVDDFVAFSGVLSRDPARLQEFKDFMTINVSEFFRDAQKFRELRDKVLPLLVRPGRSLKVWSAGCSYGAEAYSVAILLEEMRCSRYTILATDIDRAMMDRARKACDYTPVELRNVEPVLLAKYFSVADGKYAVAPQVRRHVEFAALDLLRDNFDTDFDLVLCRNVVIYFTEEAKENLYHRFYQSLRAGGVLFVGGTEVILKSREMGYQCNPCSFYWRERPQG